MKKSVLLLCTMLLVAAGPVRAQLLGSNFNQASDTTGWGFEVSDHRSGAPDISWLSRLADHSGLLVLNFAADSQGSKITSVGKFFPKKGTWLKIAVTYYVTGDATDKEMSPKILLSPSASGQQELKQISASWTGSGLIPINRWQTFTSYVYSAHSSLHLQAVAKNAGQAGTIYIDSILLTNDIPPAVIDNLPLTVPGEFSSADDTTYWAFETAPFMQSRPAVQHLSEYAGHNGVLALTFSQPSQGIKLTSDLFVEPNTDNVAIELDLIGGPQAKDVDVYLFVYAEEDWRLFRWDVAGFYQSTVTSPSKVSRFVAPLDLISNLKQYRLQVVVRSLDGSEGTVYVDRIGLIRNQR